MKEVFRPHEVCWTEEKIKRFWDYMGTKPRHKSWYFSEQVGKSILKFVKRYVSLDGRVVDLGCGPGYLIDHLLSDHIACEGIDYSEETVKRLDIRLKNNPLFRGAKSMSNNLIPLDDETVDTIFFVEVIEHILKHQIPAMLKEIHRVLKPGGNIIITIPNNEDLDLNKDICPECGCIFHRNQHISSFSANELEMLMRDSGFSTVTCKPTYFIPESRNVLAKLRNWYVSTFKRYFPHLCFIGART